VAADADVPDGAYVGSVYTSATLGLINGPCNSELPVGFDLMEATTDTSNTVTFDEQFQDSDGNTLPDGVDKYPDFLTRMFPVLTPRARHFGQASVAGSAVSLNFVLFDPGALGFDPGLGYPSVTVLNNNGDPGMEPAPSPITDFCTPLDTSVTIYGISGDNPATGRTKVATLCGANPLVEGLYSWLYARLYAMPTMTESRQARHLPVRRQRQQPRVAGDGDQTRRDRRPATRHPPRPRWMRTTTPANRGDNCPLIANGWVESRATRTWTPSAMPATPRCVPNGDAISGCWSPVVVALPPVNDDTGRPGHAPRRQRPAFGASLSQASRRRAARQVDCLVQIVPDQDDAGSPHHRQRLRCRSRRLSALLGSLSRSTAATM
jgi:hypothetical protein